MTEQIATAVSGMISDSDIPKIDRNLIYPDPEQPRTEFDPVKLNELAASIGATGQKIPAIVRVHPTIPRRFILVDGERRWRATGIAGVTFLRAYVFTGTPVEIMIKQVISNFTREGHSPLETANIVFNMKEKTGFNDLKLASIFGKSEIWIKQHLSLKKLPEEVLSRMREPIPQKKRLPLSTALLLVPFASDVQIKLATEFFTHSIGFKTAKQRILKLNNELKSTGVKKVKPYAEIRKLESFIRATSESVDVLIGMQDEVYEKGLKLRGDGYNNAMLTQLTGLQNKIETIKRTMRRAIEKNSKNK